MIINRKVVLIGTGFVGMSMAYALENQGGINELVLIDMFKEKAEGEAMDLAHGLSCAPTGIDIKAGDYDECKDADLVVICAGNAQKMGGETRLELAKANAQTVKSITNQVISTGFDGIFLVATNPVDLMTYVVQKTSNFPTNRVIGSGTVLDTARLRYLISKKVNVSPKNVHAYIMGEHGDSSFAVWSHSYVGCKPLYDILESRGEDKSELDVIYTDVQQAAYEIINKKKATYYGIGMELAKIVRTIMDDEREILTVSTYLNGNYGHSGLYIGMPAVITSEGVREIVDLNLSEEEQEKFDNSYNILEENRKMIDEVIKD